jgi:hypothetical protein
VHLVDEDDETTTSAITFLNEAIAAFPFRVTHVMTGTRPLLHSRRL